MFLTLLVQSSTAAYVSIFLLISFYLSQAPLLVDLCSKRHQFPFLIRQAVNEETIRPFFPPKIFHLSLLVTINMPQCDVARNASLNNVMPSSLAHCLFIALIHLSQSCTAMEKHLAAEIYNKCKKATVADFGKERKTESSNSHVICFMVW